jgi:hypothetical protein
VGNIRSEVRPTSACGGLLARGRRLPIAKNNIGVFPALTAAAALLTDYVLSA